MSAAARLFLERSYQAVGVDEVCAAADARKGGFYFCCYYLPLGRRNRLMNDVTISPARSERYAAA